MVEAYPDAVAVESTAGYASCVNLCESRYSIARKYDRVTADEYLNWLDDFGIETVDVGDAWLEATVCVLRYNPTLGDSFALPTAEQGEVTLLVGSDDDYNEISEVPIDRFSDGSA